MGAVVAQLVGTVAAIMDALVHVYVAFNLMDMKRLRCNQRKPRAIEVIMLLPLQSREYCPTSVRPSCNVNPTSHLPPGCGVTRTDDTRLGRPTGMRTVPLCEMEDVPALPVFSGQRSYWSSTSRAEETHSLAHTRYQSWLMTSDASVISLNPWARIRSCAC